MVLERDAMLLFYTDGLIEEREMSLSARLARLIRVLERPRTDLAAELSLLVLDHFWRPSTLATMLPSSLSKGANRAYEPSPGRGVWLVQITTGISRDVRFWYRP
jgi:hypothetical protein